MNHRFLVSISAVAVVAAAGATGDATAVLVGTISACHGAMNLLTIGRSKTVEDGQ